MNTDNLLTLLFSIHVVSAVMMFGIFWYVQMVQYPLLRLVGNEAFVDFKTTHNRLKSMAVLPPMFIEVASGILLVWYGYFGNYPMLFFSSLLLLGVGWVSSLSLQSRLHKDLVEGFCDNRHRDLYFSNWIRTLAWGGRVVLLLIILALG